MKTKNLLIILLVVGFAFLSCKKQKTELNPKSLQISSETEQIISANNEFGFEVLKKISEDGESNGNFMISPVSISLALAMTYNGAEGTTKDAMEETLNLTGLSVDEINTSYKQFIADLISVDEDVNLSIANSIWYKESFNVEPDFISVNQEYFDAEVSALDFVNPSAVETINNWVSDKTSDLITEIITEIEPNTVMFLINAIYFKGTWFYEFEQSATTELPFYLDDGGFVSVPTMNLKGDLDYYSDENLAAVQLPYGRGNYSMILMLPFGQNTADSLISKLDLVSWNEMVDNFVTAYELNLYLPKFTFEYEKELKEILSIMGMEIAFTVGADFANINPNADLYISKVKHKTFIEVNEEGTEAAAVTSVAINELSAGPGSEIKFNKPFVFAITETTTNTVLFVGKVENPIEGN